MNNDKVLEILIGGITDIQLLSDILSIFFRENLGALQKAQLLEARIYMSEGCTAKAVACIVTAAIVVNNETAQGMLERLEKPDHLSLEQADAVLQGYTLGIIQGLLFVWKLPTRPAVELEDLALRTFTRLLFLHSSCVPFSKELNGTFANMVSELANYSERFFREFLKIAGKKHFDNLTKHAFQVVDEFSYTAFRRHFSTIERARVIGEYLEKRTAARICPT